MWYIHTTEYYSVLKKNEILSFTGKWMELENTMLSKVSQVQKDKDHMFSLICGRQIQIHIQVLYTEHVSHSGNGRL
jgi:hypothetical protein